MANIEYFDFYQLLRDNGFNTLKNKKNALKKNNLMYS
jgi:hypothetical protein